MFDKKTIDSYRKLFSIFYIIKSNFSAFSGEFVYINLDGNKVKVKCLSAVKVNQECLIFIDNNNYFLLSSQHLPLSSDNSRTIEYRRNQIKLRRGKLIFGTAAFVYPIDQTFVRLLYTDTFFTSGRFNFRIAFLQGKRKKIASGLIGNFFQTYGARFPIFSYSSMGMINRDLFMFLGGSVAGEIDERYINPNQNNILDTLFYYNCIKTSSKKVINSRIFLKNNIKFQLLGEDIVYLSNFVFDDYTMVLKYLNSANKIIYIAISGSRGPSNFIRPINLSTPFEIRYRAGAFALWNLGEIEDIKPESTFETTCLVPLFIKDDDTANFALDFASFGGYGAKGGIVIHLRPIFIGFNENDQRANCDIFIAEEHLTTRKILNPQDLIFSNHPQPDDPYNFFDGITIDSMPSPLDTREIVNKDISISGNGEQNKLIYYVTEKDKDTKIFN